MRAAAPSQLRTNVFGCDLRRRLPGPQKFKHLFERPVSQLRQMMASNDKLARLAVYMTEHSFGGNDIIKAGSRVLADKSGVADMVNLLIQRETCLRMLWYTYMVNLDLYNQYEIIMRHSDKFMTADRAAAELGISRATLYAYVSRGMIHTSDAADDPRRRLYSAHDIEALKKRKTLDGVLGRWLRLRLTGVARARVRHYRNCGGPVTLSRSGRSCSFAGGEP